MMDSYVNNFNGWNNFNLLHTKMHVLLVQQELDDEEKEDLTEQVPNVIYLCFSYEILRKVVHETTTIELWIKLETFYMTKFLMN
ncbi:rhamnogalacturonate lyase [Salix suchowensis]|nr:rhamnogalacturonate lyase [Salix suchowensis]